MAERILVTGGAGFIGSHLVEELTRQGRTVRVFDNLSTGLRSNLAAIAPAPEFVEGDLADAANVRQAVEGCATIFHLGALASVARSVENPQATHAACTTGTLNVLDAARLTGAKRVVYAGSSSAYGGFTSDAGQTEEIPVKPLSPYAAAKLAGEMYLQAFASTYGIETVTLRFFNIFGPRQRADSPYSGVIALFTDALKHGRRPVVHGDGLQSRDFTYVGNAVQALIKASQAPDVSGHAFNVGTGSSVTVLDLVAALNRILGTDLAPEFGPTRAGDVRYSRADIGKARRMLNYEPAVRFEDGLRQTVAN